MFADRNLINRRNVCTDVSKKVDACKQFMILEVKARVVGCILDTLQISEMNVDPKEETLPQSIKDGTDKEKLRFLRELMERMLKKFVY